MAKKLKKLILNWEAYNLPNNSDFVDLTTNQSVWGTKTFTTSPVVPSKTSDATNSWTAIATEAQVYKKEDTLTEVTKSDMDTGTSTTAGKVSAKAISDFVLWKLTNTYTYKGTKADYDSLPTTWNVVGDVWNVTAAHTTDPKFPAWSNVAWDWEAWDVLWWIFDTSSFVNITDNQTVWGTKTFTTSPVVPSKTTDATNTGTAIATEAQVYKKLDSADLWNATITYKQWIDSTAIWTITTNQSSNGTITFHDNVLKTQTEYDNLPSTKATDWNSYWIYETVS